MGRRAFVYRICCIHDLPDKIINLFISRRIKIIIGVGIIEHSSQGLSLVQIGYKINSEYGYNSIFFVRAGYQFALLISENYICGFTTGIGNDYKVRGFGFKVDYSYRDVEFFDGNHIIALTLGV